MNMLWVKRRAVMPQSAPRAPSIVLLSGLYVLCGSIVLSSALGRVRNCLQLQKLRVQHRDLEQGRNCHSIEPHASRDHAACMPVSSMRCNSPPVSAGTAAATMPSSAAIAAAVIGWSPVIMIARMSAPCSSATAGRAARTALYRTTLGRGVAQANRKRFSQALDVLAESPFES